MPKCRNCNTHVYSQDWSAHRQTHVYEPEVIRKRRLWDLHVRLLMLASMISFVLFLVAAIVQSSYIAGLGGVFAGGACVLGLGFLGWIDAVPPYAPKSEEQQLPRAMRKEIQKAQQEAVRDALLRRQIEDADRIVAESRSDLEKKGLL